MIFNDDDATCHRQTIQPSTQGKASFHLKTSTLKRVVWWLVIDRSEYRPAKLWESFLIFSWQRYLFKLKQYRNINALSYCWHLWHHPQDIIINLLVLKCKPIHSARTRPSISSTNYEVTFPPCNSPQHDRVCPISSCQCQDDIPPLCAAEQLCKVS